LTNVLCILSDDQRADMSLGYMPTVRRVLATPGRVFTQCRTNIGSCQPSRAGILTGRTHVHHGIGPFGPGAYQLPDRYWLDGFDHDSTVGAWLQAAGYRTALVGKYLNTEPRLPADWQAAGYSGGRPAGWTVWRQYITPGKHLGYGLNADGVVKSPTAMQMDHTVAEVKAFVAGGEPWFCYVAPSNPHGPYAPAPRDLFAWSQARWRIVDEDVVDAGGVSDKPAWVRQLAPLTERDVAGYRAQARGQLREIVAVDRAVGSIVAAIPADVLARTVIVYASDNGLHYGEHRFRGPATKNTAYDVAMRVPLVVRGPGFPPGESDEDVTIPDITRTIVDVTGATAPWPLDGVNLADVVANPPAYAERPVVHAVLDYVTNPYGEGVTMQLTADGVRARRKLFRYPNQSGTDRYESYDIDADPDELLNLGESIPGFDTLAATLEQLAAGTVPIVDEVGTGTGPTVTYRSVPVDGRTMIVVARHQNAAPGTVVGPAGWAAAATSGAGTSNELVVWWKRASGETAATFTFGGGTIQWFRYLVANLDPDPVDAPCGSTSSSPTTTIRPGPFATLAAPRAFVVVAAALEGATGGSEQANDAFLARASGAGTTDALVVADRTTASVRVSTPTVHWTNPAPDPQLSWATPRAARAVGVAFKAAAG
jgi:N-acetylglucosamine-6-sulfatase